LIKKGLCGALHPNMLFQTKKNLNILKELGPRNPGQKIKKIITEKKRKRFFGFSKTRLVFE
jgi:hypothetical protein